MSEINPFAGSLVSPVEARYNRLCRIPPSPYDLEVSLLPPGMAASIRRAVIGDGTHFGMDAIIVDGQLWVKPGEVIDLTSPLCDPYDPDDGCYLAPELWVDREALAVDLAEAKAAWDLERPKDPTFSRPIQAEDKPQDRPR